MELCFHFSRRDDMPKGSSDCFEIVVAMLSGFVKKIHWRKVRMPMRDACMVSAPWQEIPFVGSPYWNPRVINIHSTFIIITEGSFSHRIFI